MEEVYEIKEEIASIYKAIDTIKDNISLLDPSEKAVLIKYLLDEIPIKEFAMTMFYSNTKKANTIANIIQHEHYDLLQEKVDKVLK